MSYHTSIALVDGATPVAQELLALNPTQTAKVVAQPLNNLFRTRFYELESTRPNKLNAPRAHFWANMARSTTAQTRGESIAIIVNAIGLGLRIHGGTIKPKGVNKITGKPLQFLTIPTVLGYGKRARELKLKPQLVDGRPALVLDNPDRKTNPKVAYWLARRATIHKDPTILPSPEAVRSASVDAIRKYVALQVKRAQAKQSQP
jgi:hypothetical protein